MFEAVNHAVTTIGQAVLYRSLTQPLNSLDAIQAKQDAVKELQENPALKAELETHRSHNAAADEKNFYLLLFGEFLGSMGTARQSTKLKVSAICNIVAACGLCSNWLTAGQSRYARLKALISKVFLIKFSDFTESRDYSLMQGPVYISERGIQSKEQRKGSFVPAVIFKPRLFKPLLIAYWWFWDYGY